MHRPCNVEQRAAAGHYTQAIQTKNLCKLWIACTCSKGLGILLGPFHGAIAVTSVTRCRCCRRRCGHRCAGGMRQYSGDTWWIGMRRLVVANGPNIFSNASCYYSRRASMWMVCTKDSIISTNGEPHYRPELYLIKVRDSRPSNNCLYAAVSSWSVLQAVTYNNIP